MCGLNRCPVFERINTKETISEKLKKDFRSITPEVLIGWHNYPEVNAGIIAPYEIIKTQNVKNYNIVNHIYDNLSVVIKFHLRKDEVKINYDDYYHNDHLYVISKSEYVFEDPAYELNTFIPNKLVGRWKLNETYNLYLFKRIKN